MKRVSSLFGLLVVVGWLVGPASGVQGVVMADEACCQAAMTCCPVTSCCPDKGGRWASRGLVGKIVTAPVAAPAKLVSFVVGGRSESTAVASVPEPAKVEQKLEPTPTPTPKPVVPPEQT